MVRLNEHQGKILLSEMGIAVPKGKVARTRSEARSVAETLKGAVVLKPQVLTGKRGMAGAIKFANTPTEAETQAQALLGSRVCGCTVHEILVEEKADVKREFYMAVMSDPREKKPICIVSSAGGMGIEEITQRHPELVTKRHVDISVGLRDYEARNIIRKLPGIPNSELLTLTDTLTRLYGVYRNYDCKLAEINPLATDGKGKFVALDARIDLDDDATYRHPELGLSRVDEVGRSATPLEIAAGRIDEGDYRGTAHFVQTDPDGSYCRKTDKVPIGLDCVGGGASLTTMDELADLGYMPVNFADTSGNPTGAKLYKITKIILCQPHIRGYVFVSCMSSQQLDHTARGIIKALKELYPTTGGRPNVPMVFCIRGSWDHDAHRLFREHGIADSSYVRLLGRESTELDAAKEFHALYQRHESARKV